MAKHETLASIEVFTTLKRRGHPDGPPPTSSAGGGGIDEAMGEGYGSVPEYWGRGRPPPRKQAGAAWQDVQMVKQRDQCGRVPGGNSRGVGGQPSDVRALLGESTAYIERRQLTSRLCNGRQGRKTLACSNNLAVNRAAAGWEASSDNLGRPHKSLRLPIPDDPVRRWQPRTPAIAATLTDHMWTVKELLTALPLPSVNNTS